MKYYQLFIVMTGLIGANIIFASEKPHIDCTANSGITSAQFSPGKQVVQTGTSYNISIHSENVKGTFFIDPNKSDTAKLTCECFAVRGCILRDNFTMKEGSIPNNETTDINCKNMTCKNNEMNINFEKYT